MQNQATKTCKTEILGMVHKPLGPLEEEGGVLVKPHQTTLGDGGVRQKTRGLF